MCACLATCMPVLVGGHECVYVQAAAISSRKLLQTRRWMSEALVCACLLPGAALGALTVAVRALMGKQPFPSMMGGSPPAKRKNAP